MTRNEYIFIPADSESGEQARMSVWRLPQGPQNPDSCIRFFDLASQMKKKCSTKYRQKSSSCRTRPVFSDSLFVKVGITKSEFFYARKSGRKGQGVMREISLTITGMRHYYGNGVIHVGDILRCRKEPENEYDAEAIQVLLPVYGKVGYIANSPYTVARGTLSAGRAYDQVKKKFYVRVLYICTNQIICKVEEGRKEDLESKISRQIRAIDDTEF